MGFEINFRTRFGIACGLTIMFAVTSILFYFPGYNTRIKWNDGAIKTECLIIGHTVKDDICFDRTNCKTCHYTCHDGFIKVRYTTLENQTLFLEEEVISDSDHSEDVDEELLEDYPVGIYIDCYYQKNDVYDLRLPLRNTTIFLVFSIIFGVIAGLVAIFWIIYEAKESGIFNQITPRREEIEC